MTHMTLAEFVTTQYGDEELPEVLEDAERITTWMDDKEAELGVAPTFDRCGTRVYHPVLLDYRMYMLACGV